MENVTGHLRIQAIMLMSTVRQSSFIKWMIKRCYESLLILDDHLQRGHRSQLSDTVGKEVWWKKKKKKNKGKKELFILKIVNVRHILTFAI